MVRSLTGVPGDNHEADEGGLGALNTGNGHGQRSLRSGSRCLVCKRTSAKCSMIDIIGDAEVRAYDNGDHRRWNLCSVGAVVSVSQGIAMLRARSPVSRLSWRKSSYSLPQGECVEVAAISDGIAVRDSNDKYQTLLLCLAADWRALMATIKKLER